MEADHPKIGSGDGMVDVDELWNQVKLPLSGKNPRREHAISPIRELLKSATGRARLVRGITEADKKFKKSVLIRTVCQCLDSDDVESSAVPEKDRLVLVEAAIRVVKGQYNVDATYWICLR